VLNFFANNCGYCKKQIPRLAEVAKGLEGKGIRFINVAETMRQEFTPEQTMETMKQLGWTHEVIIDSKNEIGPLFGATGYPTMIVLGKDGKVAAANVGNIGDLETRVKGQLTALAEGKPIPAELVQAPKQERPPGPESLVGHPAPAFTMTTIDGKSVSNADFAANAATVLNFMAPNCGFCKKQVPRVETVQKEFDGKPVRFVNVVMTMGKEFSQEEALAILKETGWTEEVARDPKNEVGRMFRVSGFPTMSVVGKNGKVQAVHVGNVGDLETKLKSQLEDLIAGKELAATPAPSAAPAAPKKRPAEELVGQPAPEFALTTMDGKAIASADFSKHPATVLNFVAPNCGFCKKQVPNVDKVRAEFEAKGVRFVNVAEKMGAKEFPNEEIIKIFKDAGSNLEMAKDDGNQVGQKYKATSFPTMVVVGKDGKVANVFVGAKPDIETLLKTQLEQMMK
jgi:thiol-disulfide isomerase/thioredoxin